MILEGHGMPRDRKRRVIAAATFLIALLLIATPRLVAADSDRREPTRAGTAEDPVDSQIAALEKLRSRAKGPTNVSFENGVPRAVETSVEVSGENPIDRAKAFLRKYGELYGQYMADPFDRFRHPANRIGLVDADEAESEFRRRLRSFRGEPT